MLGLEKLAKLSEQISAAMGAVGRMRETLSALLGLAENRLSLLAVEIEAEKLRLIEILMTAAAALFFLGFGILFGSLALVFAFWETHREWILALVAVVFLMLGMMLLYRLHRKTGQSGQLFQASLDELRKDQEALKHHD